MRIYEVRGRRRRGLLPGLVAVLAVLAVAALFYLVADKRVVIPGLSTRIFSIEYQEDIARVARTYDIDPYLVAAVARTESGFDPAAVSPAGAVGMMQLMPETAEWIVGLDRWQGADDPVLTDPRDSLELGACYLAFLNERFADDERAAVAAYNAGQGVVARWVSEAGGGGLSLDDIVYPETRTFVERVEEWLQFYQKAHPEAFGMRGLRT